MFTKVEFLFALCILFDSPFLEAGNIVSLRSQSRPTRPSNKLPAANSSSCKRCACGTTKALKARIVGGEESLETEYPWIVGLYFDKSFVCGGSLINDRFILTAAHCFADEAITELSIKLFSYTSSFESTEGIVKKAAGIIVHESYDANMQDNDIALIELDSQVEFVDLPRFGFSCLPTSNRSYDSGQMAIVAGWGHMRQGAGVISVNLREVSVPIISNEECHNMGVYKVTDNMFCAGLKQGGRDSCQGDSGGPIHIQQGNRFIQIGVVSWGVGCARPNRPGVYVRIINYLKWIKKHTKGACYCSDNN